MKYTRLNNAFLTVIVLAASTAIANSAQEGRLAPGAAAHAASELAELLRDHYVFPEIGRQYSDALEARIDDGVYAADFDLAELADDLEIAVNEVHRDAHLRVSASGARSGGPRRMWRIPGGSGAVGTTAWIDDDIAYVELLALPGDEASQEAMSGFLDAYRGARALIVDARFCPGGTLPVIDVLSSRLFDKPTHLVTMDMRVGANNELRQNFEALPSLRPAKSDATLTRFEHWATPSSDPADRAWADVPVYLLTDMTASACEHLALALKITGRATLVGNTTRGAGHFGGMRSFADGSLEVFLPVGRTYDPANGKDWEGTGVRPDVDVPANHALEAALTDLGVNPGLAASVSPQGGSAPGVAVRRVNRDGPSYGLGIMPPRGGESFIEVMMVDPDAAAGSAGVRKGDRIVAMNGTRIADMDQAAVIQALQSPRLALDVVRAEEELEFQLTLE